mgnify:CR=1 FL=1
MRKILILAWMALCMPLVANATPTPLPCSTSDVQVNFIRPLDQPTGVNIGPINSGACLGAYVGNNSMFLQPSQGNLGFKDDGWLNIYGYGAWFPPSGPTSVYTEFWDTPGAFIISLDMLQDLRTEGVFEDPGWIRLGKDEGSGFIGDSSTKGGLTYTFENNLLTFSNCKDIDGNHAQCIGGDAVSGEWSFNPPEISPPELFDILGGDFFDQLSVVFMGANTFAMYTFSLSDLGLDPILPGGTKFQFAGTFNLGNTLGGAISNVELWGRDPTGDINRVPEPGILLLMGLSLLLLQIFRRPSAR